MARNRTPLRYPGGKQRLTPFVKKVLERNNLLGAEYAEPYAGGAGVAIELLLSNCVSKIHLNDANQGVYAFWHSILNHTEDFCRRIVSASMTVTEWRRHKAIVDAPDGADRLDLGFSTFILNRTNRSGIQSAGVIGGLKQDGEWKMDARFPRNDLIHRIEAIALQKSRIRIRNWDAEKYIKQYIPRLPQASLVYFDPPYFNKADRLYLHHYKPSDHQRIAKQIQENVFQPWIVSYDQTTEIIDHYRERNRVEYDLQYNASESYTGREVMFFSDELAIPELDLLSNPTCELVTAYTR